MHYSLILVPFCTLAVFALPIAEKDDVTSLNISPNPTKAVLEPAGSIPDMIGPPDDYWTNPDDPFPFIPMSANDHAAAESIQKRDTAMGILGKEKCEWIDPKGEKRKVKIGEKR